MWKHTVNPTRLNKHLHWTQIDHKETVRQYYSFYLLLLSVFSYFAQYFYTVRIVLVYWQLHSLKWHRTLMDWESVKVLRKDTVHPIHCHWRINHLFIISLSFHETSSGRTSKGQYPDRVLRFSFGNCWLVQRCQDWLKLSSWPKSLVFWKMPRFIQISRKIRIMWEFRSDVVIGSLIPWLAQSYMNFICQLLFG
jgi:hypothetical protein